MQKKNGFISQGKIAVQGQLDGFISVSKRMREIYGLRGAGRVYDSTNKIYISMQGTKPTVKAPNPKPYVAFNLGMEVCKKARFIMGDYIEVLYNKNTNTFFFRRTNNAIDGYKLGPSGGRKAEEGRHANTAVFKMMHRKEFLPEVKELSELENVIVNNDGVFATYKGAV
jgi:hypothetical protein